LTILKSCDIRSLDTNKVSINFLINALGAINVNP